MSKMIESESDLDKMLSECSHIFVLFYATWCPYSRRFLPIFENYALGNDQQFCRVMTDQVSRCEDTYDIEVVPTVIFFENGRAAMRLEGVPGSGITEKQLDSFIHSCDLPGNDAEKPGRIK
jgi:thioredoxin-like negative regulator of GroEL